MMHRRGSPRLRHSSWEADEQGGGDPLRSRWSQGRRPRGMRGSKARTGHRVEEPVSQALERIRQSSKAKEEGKGIHRAPPPRSASDLLDEEAFFEDLGKMPRRASMSLIWTDYEQNLERNLEDLRARIHPWGAYRACCRHGERIYPSRMAKQRPLAIAALEDKIVQRATVAVLNAIYEEDFLGFSYGFRPGRGTHGTHWMRSLSGSSTKVNWILDADVRSFFDEISQQWLVRFLEHRIGDRRIISLSPRRWLKVGILEEGVVTVSEEGTGQGAVISPLLANVYLHYVLDLWAGRWRRREVQAT